MKHNSLRVALLTAALILVAIPALAETLVEKTDQTHAFPGGVFTLDNVNGSVEIISWDRPEVRIEAEKRVQGRSREAVESAMARLKIEVRSSHAGLGVRTRYPNSGGNVIGWLSGSKTSASVRYLITVPRQAKVSVDTVNASITVDGVEGGYELETVNGRIDVSRGAGSLEASTVNGGIRAELLTTRGQLKLETVNGSVELTVPREIQADVRVSTVNGRIQSDLPLVGSEIGRRSLRGSINGGGGISIRIATVNGSVRIGPS
jgi:hypothetical protein